MKGNIKILGLFVLLIMNSCDSDNEVYYKELDLKIKELTNKDGVDLNGFERIEKITSKGYPELIYRKVLPWKDTAEISGFHTKGFSRRDPEIIRVNGPYNYLITNKDLNSKYGYKINITYTMDTLFGERSQKIKLSSKQNEIEKKYNYMRSGEFLLDNLKKGNFFYLGKEGDSMIVQFYSPFIISEYYNFEKAFACILQDKKKSNEIIITPVTEDQSFRFTSNY